VPRLVCGELELSYNTFIHGLRQGLKNIINEVVSYLLSGKVGSKIVGRGASGDVTKEFDKVSEDILVRGLRALFNDSIVIVSEELGFKAFGKPKWLAIMDPVDGSTNYDAGIPWVAVSLGLARFYEGKELMIKDIEIALVANVYEGTIYEYFNGKVYANGKEVVRLSKPKNVVLGYFEKPEAYKIIPSYWSVRGRRAALRSLGSVALEMIYVGLGRAEAFVDLRAKIRNVDVAAAYRIALALGAKAALCDESPLEEFPINNIANLRCVLMGYNENILSMLREAYRRAYKSMR